MGNKTTTLNVSIDQDKGSFQELLSLTSENNSWILMENNQTY